MPTYYLNAGADSGGDGSTNATTSGDSSHAFDSMSGAEAAIQAVESDLSVSGKVTLLCEGTTADTTACVWDGFTNASASNYIEILGNDTGLITGVPSGGYSITNTSITTLEIRVPFTRIGSANGDKGIEIDNNGGTNDDGLYINGTANAVDMTDVYVCGCLIWTDDPSSSRDAIVLDFDGQGADAGRVYIRNTAMWGWTLNGISKIQGTSGDTSIVDIEHCFAYDCSGDGLRNVANTGETSTFNVYNTISFGNGTDIDDSGLGTVNYIGSNNITGDATYNFGSLSSGAQATSGISDSSQTSGAWVVVTESLSGSTTNLKLLDEEAGNLPVAFGADRTSTVSVDAFGTTRATASDNGFFEFAGGGGPTTWPRASVFYHPLYGPLRGPIS